MKIECLITLKCDTFFYKSGSIYFFNRKLSEIKVNNVSGGYFGV